MGWRQVTSDAQGDKMLSTMSMETNSSTFSDIGASTISQEHLLFKREVRSLFQMPNCLLKNLSLFCSVQMVLFNIIVAFFSFYLL